MRKLLVVGVDAGSATLFDRWMATGDMPNLASLKRTGAWGPVRNPYALEAGAVWPVFHSGLAPGNFPQYDGRRYFDCHDYSTRWYDAQQTPTPFWRTLSDQGIECLIIDPPYTHLDPELNGRMVVDWGGHVPANGQRFELQTHPPSLLQTVLDTVGPDPAEGEFCDDQSPESIKEYRQFYQRYRTRIDKRAHLAKHLLQSGDWQFALIASTDLHCTGHHLWHVNDRQHPEYRPELEQALGEPLRECYRAFDRSLGEILEAADDETMVMVFGSHGMGPQYTGTGLLDRVLLALDKGRPAPKPMTFKSRLRSLWRKLPIEWRARMRMIRRLSGGSLHAPRFLGDHANRRFFEVYANNATGGVRINLRGREGHGKVAPEEYDALTRQICEDLRKVINVDTGEPLVEDLVLARDRYTGACVDSLPDILVRWNRSAPIRRVHSDKIGHIAQEAVDNRTGDHTPDGVFFLGGAALRLNGELPAVEPQDFAPSIAAYFGVRCGASDGKLIPAFTISHRAEAA